MDYTKLLEESLIFRVHIQSEPTKYELVAEIFDFTTYDGEMDELFARKAIQVCNSITQKTTFDFIKDEENYKWYLLLLNMPFFSTKIEWGTSIRGAWWDTYNGISLDNICWAFYGDEQLTRLEFDSESWVEFLAAVDRFLS